MAEEDNDHQRRERKLPLIVTPAEALGPACGANLLKLDSGIRRNDEFEVCSEEKIGLCKDSS
jgi:hypothetical protein